MAELVLDAAALAAALKNEPGQPLHRRLEHSLRSLIESGQIAVGAVLPGELELAAQLAVSRHTIRHALGVLTNEGLLRRERGRGTTVMPPSRPHVYERSLSTFYAFAWEVRARGGEQHSYVLERTVMVADDLLRQHLGLTADTEVERMVRLRTADGAPLVLETAYLPRALTATLPQTSLERESIYDALEQVHDLRITRAHESIRPIVLSRAVAKLLHAPAGSAAFEVERTTWTDRGPIEWQQSVVRGDRFLYSVDLPRP